MSNPNHKKHTTLPGEEKVKGNRQLKYISKLSERVTDLEKVNGEIRDTRQAALNMMEDAVLAKEAAQLSEEKYRAIFNSIDEGFCIYEVIYDNEKPVDLKWIEVNPGYEKQTGLKNVVGKFHSDLSLQTESYWYDLYDKVVRTGEPLEIEKWHGATQRWYHTFASRIETNSNQVAVVFNDITERKCQEQRQKFLLKLSDTLRSIDDPATIEETVTQLALNHFEADRCYYCTLEGDDAVISRDAKKENLPSVAGTYAISSFPLFRKVVDEGRPFVVYDANTTDILDEELRQLCLQLQVISFVDVPVVKKGTVVGILSLVQSTPRNWKESETELVKETAERVYAAVESAKAEESLRHSEENFRAIVNQSITGIFKTDLEGHIIFCNDHFAKMLDYTVDELLNMSLADIVYEEDLERTKILMRELAEKGKSFEIEKRMKRRNGSLLWVLNQIAALHNSHPKPVAAVGVCSDISQQKATEQKKDEFISIASHELKTPVTSIKAYSELLQEMCNEGDYVSGGNLIKKLGRQVDRLIDLLRDLLDVTKIAQGELQLNFSYFDLHQLIEERAEDMQRTTTSHEIIIQTENEITVHADRERIAQVLLNLISNSIKYSPQGGPITISYGPTSEGIEIAIKDQGIGISEKMKTKIFDRFVRASDVQLNTFPGMGLGLYITSNIIHRHGGQIWVESEAGKGSEFHFTIPAPNTD
jgi:PAS domain S-box-containing protein